MKDIIFTFCLLLSLFVSKPLFSDVYIEYAEYFVDSDPGFGSGTEISISPPASDLTLDFNIDLTLFSLGFHKLYVRAMDQYGNWGVQYSKTLYKTQPPPTEGVVAAEYFIDKDPGLGNGNSVPFASGKDLILDVTVPLDNLTLGFHRLYVRAMDQNGKWSIQFSRTLYKTQSPPAEGVVAAEYFIDSDPGFGNGVSVPFLPGKDLIFDVTVPLNNLTLGFHRLNVRAMDQNGKWSIQFSRTIYKTQSPSDEGVVAAEYFIDSDPGFGNGISIPLASGLDITSVFLGNLNTLSLGPHTLYVRARDGNGNYSIALSQEIIISVDSDQDLLPDIWEYEHFGDLSHDGTNDSDNDGLSDAEEYFQCTDPNDPDSDGDGIYDGVDNCANIFNPDQQDSDQDGNGNSCDFCPGANDNLDHDGDGQPSCIDPTQFYWPMFLPVIISNGQQ